MKLQEEYGDQIQVILVEVQGHASDEVEAFALKKKWFGTHAIWTTERPFSTGLPGIPNYALIAPNGEIASVGYSTQDHGKVKDMIEDFVKNGGSAPPDVDSSVEKIYKRVDKGDFGKALEEVDKLIAKLEEKGEAEVLAQARAARDAVLAHAERAMGRIQWMLQNGYAMRAEDRWSDFRKAIKGAAALEEKAAELAASFEDEAMKAEIAAERALARLEGDLYESGGDDEKLVKKLEKLIEEHAGTKAAGRAERLAEIARNALTLRV